MRSSVAPIRFPIVSILLLLLTGLLQSCSSSKDLYRVSSISWHGDSIQVQVIDKQVPARPAAGLETELECLTCNFHLEPWYVTLDQKGTGRFLLPEAKQLITTRIAVRGDDIDTVAVLLQPSPEEAEDRFWLTRPLIGRVMLLGLAVLYYDSAYDSIAISARLQDEINIYAEEEDHYIVHHPHFSQPLYLRKLGVVRLR